MVFDDFSYVFRGQILQNTTPIIASNLVGWYKNHIYAPVSPCPRNLLYASRRSVFSASVSTSGIFGPKLQAGAVNRKAALSEAFLAGAASRGEAAPCQVAEEA